MVSPGEQPRKSLETPSVVGDFEIRHEIGRGGMGIVYEAWQRSLQRTVALKILSSHVSASPDGVRRFQREAQAAAKLSHTHIIPIFHQGEENGVYFYAMELVDGSSLNELLAGSRNLSGSGSLADAAAETVQIHRSAGRESGGQAAAPTSSRTTTVSDSGTMVPGFTAHCKTSEHFSGAARHIADIADALDYAHQRGVVHRDIKPHNLMLGIDGRMRVADFGLARLTENPGVTMTGEMLGSPMYMSPEQIREGPSRLDGRTDVYSLAVTMYEWLALRPPFPGETRETVISSIIHVEPPMPRSLNPLIPVELEIICMKGMSKDLHRRYQSAAAFRDDLRNYLASRPIKAKAEGLTGRIRKGIRRRPALTVGAAAIVMTALLGAALFQKQRQVQVNQAQTRDAQHQVDTVREQFARETQGVLDRTRNVEEENARLLEIVGSVLPIESLITRGAASPIAQRLVKSGQSLSERNFIKTESDVPDAGSPAQILRLATGELYGATQSPDSISFGDPADGFSALVRNAHALRETDPKVAFGLLEDVVRSRPELRSARELHASLAGQLGEHAKMVDDAEMLVRLNSSDANAYLWRGLAYFLQGRVEPSIADFHRAAQLDAESAWARILLAISMVHVARAAEAVVILDEVIQMEPKNFLALLGRAAAHAAIGNFTLAVTDTTRALEQKPADVNALVSRGDNHAQLGNFNMALADFEQAMEIAGLAPTISVRWMAVLRQKKQRDAELQIAIENAAGSKSDETDPRDLPRLPSFFDLPRPTKQPQE